MGKYPSNFYRKESVRNRIRATFNISKKGIEVWLFEHSRLYVVFLYDYFGVTEYAYDSMKKDKLYLDARHRRTVSYFSLSRLTA